MYKNSNFFPTLPRFLSLISGREHDWGFRASTFSSITLVRIIFRIFSMAMEERICKKLGCFFFIDLDPSGGY